MRDFLEWAFVTTREGHAAIIVLLTGIGILAVVLWSDYRYYQFCLTLPWNR